MLARRKILVDGVETYYWERNVADGPTVLFVHGLKGEHSGLTAVTEPFDGYRVILIDLPGYGLTGQLRKQHSMLNYARFIYQFCQELQIKRFHMVGHSYGGSIAIVYAGLFSETLLSLSLLMPAIPTRSASRWLAELGLKVTAYLPESAQKLLLYSAPMEAISFLLMVRTLSRKRKIAAIKKRFSQVQEYDMRVLDEGLRSFTTTAFLRYAKKIAVPTLIIGGDKDFIAPPKSLHLLESTIGLSEYVLIPGAGHLAPMEIPGTLATRIIGFMRGSRVASTPSKVSLSVVAGRRMAEMSQDTIGVAQ